MTEIRISGPRKSNRESLEQWADRTAAEERMLWQEWKRLETEGASRDEVTAAFNACSAYKNQVSELARVYCGPRRWDGGYQQ